MLKVLWVCNTPLPEIKKLIKSNGCTESWLIGISNQLRKKNNIKLYYVFPQKMHKKMICRTIDNIDFLGFYDTHKNVYQVEEYNIKIFQDIIESIKPDVIHIFGTEFAHSLEWVKSLSDTDRIVVSIQGLTSELSKIYLDGIPLRFSLAGSIVNGKYNCLLQEKYEFYKRGKNERKVLLNVKNVIGRTDWDKKCVLSINHKCHYYYCGEILRDTFYNGKWDINNIKRDSIFISQAYYPIKGLHILISALPAIKEEFSDVKVYVAGKKNFIENGNSYGKYIKKLIKKYHVDKNIIFLGTLTEDKVKKQLLKSHISLMPSILENSPNSIAESMILGVPVVAANVGGIPSIMDSGGEGYLYPSTDKKKLAEAVCKIFRNDRLALKFSQNGKKRAEELYSKETNSSRLMEIYSQIVKI